MAVRQEMALYKLSGGFPSSADAELSRYNIPKRKMPRYGIVYRRSIGALVSANALLDRACELLWRCAEETRTLSLPPTARETSGMAFQEAGLRSLVMGDRVERVRGTFRGSGLRRVRLSSRIKTIKK